MIQMRVLRITACLNLFDGRLKSRLRILQFPFGAKRLCQCRVSDGQHEIVLTWQPLYDMNRLVERSPCLRESIHVEIKRRTIVKSTRQQMSIRIPASSENLNSLRV